MIVSFRRTQADHSPLHINGTNVERVKSSKFLGVHMTEDLSWTLNTTCLVKNAKQRVYFMRRLKRSRLSTPILTSFYRGLIKSVLTSCLTVWYGNCTASNRKTLQ